MGGKIEQGNSYVNQFRDILYNAGYDQNKIMGITDEEIIDIFNRADEADGVKDNKINPQKGLFEELKNNYNIDFEAALEKSIIGGGSQTEAAVEGAPLDTLFQPKDLAVSDNFSPTMTVYIDNNPQIEIIVPGQKKADSNKNNIQYSVVNKDSIKQQNIGTKKSNKNNSANGVDGVINEGIKQSNQGGCWLISGVMALNSTPKGKEAIKDAITVNDDGSVTVNFKGVGAEYTITPDEIKKYDTDNNLEDLYSNGDNDMLVLEIAAEKLRQDINSGKINVNSNSATINAARNDINAGTANQLMYYLTGVEAEEYNEINSNSMRTILQNALNDGNTALSFSLRAKDNKETNFSANLTNGEKYSVNIGPENGHAFAITGLTKDTVTFVNPYDTSKPCTMTWDEFEKFGVSMIASAKI